MKRLNEMIKGDFGKVAMIRGKAAVHRYLLELGITVGRIIYVVNGSADSELEPVMVRIGRDVFSLNRDIASNININMAKP